MVAAALSAGMLTGGVRVEGTFSGPTGGATSATTDSNGQAVLKSPLSKGATGDWTFCVTNLTLAGYGYNGGQQCASTGVPATFGTIEGIITDGTNGGFLQGATVSVAGQDYMTGVDGAYLISNVPTGSQTVTASKTGYQSQNQTVIVDENSTPPANFTLYVFVQGADPIVNSCTPNNGNTNQRMTVTLGGSGFQSGATVDFGPQIAIQNVTVASDTKLDVQIKIQKRATSGLRDVTVTNPDGGSSSLVNCFIVN